MTLFSDNSFCSKIFSLFARCDSRRYTLGVPTADVREVYRFHTDECVIVQPDLPAIVASRFRTANETLLAVEVRGTAEPRQANIEFKVQTIENRVRDFVVETARWVGYQALQRGVAVAVH